MKYSESRKHLAPALIKVQGQIKNLLKTKLNEYLNVNYVPLPVLLDYVRPILTKCDLVLIQGNEGSDGEPAVTTCIMHESGEWVETITTTKMVFAAETFEELALDKASYIQKYGGQITYMRRYAIFSILGISGEDLDGRDMTPREARERAEKFRRTMGVEENPEESTPIVVKKGGKVITLAEKLEKLPKDLKALFLRIGADSPIKQLAIMRKVDWKERAATKECLRIIKATQKKGPRGPHKGLDTMTVEHAAILEEAIVKHKKNIKRKEKQNHAKV